MPFVLEASCGNFVGCAKNENEDNFYFEDVYSTVAFSQKMFANVNNTFANYDILGGWMCKSPLYQAKLKQYHIGI